MGPTGYGLLCAAHLQGALHTLVDLGHRKLQLRRRQSMNAYEVLPFLSSIHLFLHTLNAMVKECMIGNNYECNSERVYDRK